MQPVELLAPAGNSACLHAAVRAGANAVYLGVESFNARRSADNFTLEQLAEACDWAHIRGVRIYLTVNTIVLPSEMREVEEVIRQAWLAGVDAFIVQDIGLAARTHEGLPEAEVHISTQMNIHNLAGIDAAYQLGAARVTLARELTYFEIDNIASYAHSLGMEIEVFAHGALCICYSGQCFASSMVGNRSANRGMCAQACRLPYTLHNRATDKPPPAEGDHLLSPKDLCTIDTLPELVAAGADSLKIEGRMKSPEYVYAVTRAYRSVLDRVCGAPGSDPAVPDLATSDAPVRATEKERRSLEESFSRGFTTAYLDGSTGAEMMSFGRPNNRGAFLGRVAKVGGGSVELDCELPLALGDVIEFWTCRGHFTHTIDAFEIVREGAKTSRVRLAVPKSVGKDDRVFRVRSAEAAFVDDAHLPKVPVQAHIELRQGQPVLLSLQGGIVGESPVMVQVKGDIVEPARTKALTEDEVREHIARLGGTPFSLERLEVGLDEGVGMSFSRLHALRTQAADQLQANVLAPYKIRVLPKQPKRANVPALGRAQHCTVAVLATNPACARAARKAGAEVIYVSVLNYKRGQSTVAGQLSDTVEQTGYPNRVVPALPTVDHELVSGGGAGASDPSAVNTRETSFDFDPWYYVKAGKSVLADNFGQVYRAYQLGCQVEAGPHIPVTNEAAANLLQQWGVGCIWLSPELTLGQIQAIAEQSDVPLGLTIIGNQELMVTEHCLLTSQGPCNRKCTTCVRRKSPYYLKDRKDYEMPVVTDMLGRSHLYNAVQLDIAHAAPDLLAAGIRAFMVDATLMTVEQTKAATTRAIRARDLALRGAGSVARAKGTTTGHLFRTLA